MTPTGNCRYYNVLVEYPQSTYSILQVRTNSGLHRIGLIVRDPQADRLAIHITDRFPDDCGEDLLEVLNCLEQDFCTKAQELGAGTMLQHLEDTLSHSVLISDRRRVDSTSDRGLRDLCIRLLSDR